MIHKLDRENAAQLIIRQLPRLWNSISHLATQLKDTDRIYTTTELIQIRDGFAGFYSKINAFKSAYGTWFNSRYPEFADALDGAISSLHNINVIINNGLQTYYWDEETGKPIVAEISQTHRDSLANSIEGELEQ